MKQETLSNDSLKKFADDLTSFFKNYLDNDILFKELQKKGNHVLFAGILDCCHQSMAIFSYKCFFLLKEHNNMEDKDIVAFLNEFLFDTSKSSFNRNIKRLLKNNKLKKE